MCFDPITIGAITITSGMVASAAASAVVAGGAAALTQAAQVQSQNRQAVQMYSEAQKQQELVNRAAIDRYNETVSRQRLDARRQAEKAQYDAERAQLENMRRQSAATTSAATSGLTGPALTNLFNDYQVSAGNIASNLDTNLQQITENLFFNRGDARREAQSTMNSAIPARPYMAKFSLLPVAASAVQAGGGNFIGNLGV